MDKQSKVRNTQLTPTRLRSLKNMAQRLRKHSLISTSEAASGHPTSCCSCADIVATLEKEGRGKAAVNYRKAALEPDNPDPGKALVNLGATSFLRKPVHGGAIYTALFLGINQFTATVGASGGVFGVMMAFAILHGDFLPVLGHLDVCVAHAKSLPQNDD